MTQSPIRTSALLILALAVAGVFASRGAAAPAPIVAPNVAPLDQHTLDKHANGVIKALRLEGAKADAVRGILETHFQAVQAWHAAHAAELAALWSDWSVARTPPHQDEAKAAVIANQIYAAYAGFAPQHDAFIAALGRELAPEQIEKLKNVLTKKPGMQRTYKAYLQMIPTFTSEQKAVIHHKLEQAREASLDSASPKETIALFKLRKVEIEAYIDSQGLDYKKAYAAFCERIKEESEARKKKHE